MTMNRSRLSSSAAARRWITRYYRGTFIAMGAIFVAVVTGALIVNAFAHGRDDELAELRATAAKTRDPHEKLMRRRTELEKAMVAVYDFQKAWTAASVSEKDAAEEIRSTMENVAQKQLSLVTDTPITPQPELYKFETLPMRVQKVSLRASGKDLSKILVWLGTVEAHYPLAAVELCEFSSNVGGNTALLVRLAEPLGNAFAWRRSPPPAADQFEQQYKDFTPEAINAIAWAKYSPAATKGAVGIGMIRNPLQPAVAADVKVPVVNDEHDEIAPKLEQVLNGHVRSVIRAASPFIVVDGRSVGIGSEVTIGNARALENLKTTLKEVGATTLTFHVSGQGGDRGLEKDVKYNLPLFLQAR